MPPARTFLGVTLLVASCNTPYDEAGAPTALDADPESSGLVAVECRMENRSTFGNEELRLAGGSVTRLETGQRWYTLQREGLLIFDGLPPGTYLVDYVKSEPWVPEVRGAGQRDVEHRPRSYTLPRAPGFEFLVEPGAATFFGPLTACNGRSRGDVWVDLPEEPTAEARAWRKILRLYPDSSWSAVVQRRLEELR